MAMIYLDNAATTCIAPSVLESMMPFLKESYGNAGTIYKLGREAAGAIAKARRQVAQLINASPEQIIFTSGGSEANSLVFQGLRAYLNKIGKRHIIVSAVEHDSVIKVAMAMRNPLRCNEKNSIKLDFDVSFLSVDDKCVVSVDELRDMLTDDVGLVSVMYVNNETGAVNPVKEIAQLCKSRGVLFHTDCVQAAGCHKIDVEEIGCDFLSISSHKIHGCKGVGALFTRNKYLLEPIIYGGAEQEYGFRAGTENVAGIVGFGEACRLAYAGMAEYVETVTTYKKTFFNVLLQELGELSNVVTVNGAKISDDGKILNITVQGADAETLLLMMDANDVCISAGSACRSHESEPSHVLMAMGLSEEDARSSLRISFSGYNSTRDIETSASILAKNIKLVLGGY